MNVCRDTRNDIVVICNKQDFHFDYRITPKFMHGTRFENPRKTIMSLLPNKYKYICYNECLLFEDAEGIRSKFRYNKIIVAWNRLFHI